VEVEDTGQMPMLLVPEEDKAHIFKCPATLAVALWNKNLEELENWLVAVKTHPQLQQDISHIRIATMA